MLTSRPQQPYDHRLRDLVKRTGTQPSPRLSVSRAQRRVGGWRGPLVVVSLEVADLTEPELRQEILKLRRRVEKLAALLRLALALLHTSGFRFSGERSWTETTSCGSYAPWIRRTSVCRCERSSGSWVCRRVGFRPGADGRTLVRSTTSRPSSHVTASTDAPRGPGDRGHGHLRRVSSRPNRHARHPRAAARHRVGVAIDLVRPRPEVRLSTPHWSGGSGRADVRGGCGSLQSDTRSSPAAGRPTSRTRASRTAERQRHPRPRESTSPAER